MAGAAEDIAGGCFCGALRYRIERVEQVANCHCSLCRRTSGAPFVTWLVVPREAFAWTLGTPAHLQSSARGERWFCAACGTPIACRVAAQPDHIDITLGSLDHPDRFTPALDVHRRSRLPWVPVADRRSPD
jgi:hypothetical protein